jgi:AcrR family transcriptional regulator
MGREGVMRPRILRTALQLFAELGYENTSIRELGARLGITSAALYYHFTNKAEILESLTSSLIVDLEKVVSRAERMPEGEKSAHEILRSYLDVIKVHPGLIETLERSLPAVRELPAVRDVRSLVKRLATILVRISPVKGNEVRAVAALTILTVMAVDYPERKDQLIAAAVNTLGFDRGFTGLAPTDMK